MAAQQEVKNIYQRLHAVMGEVGYIQKEDKKVNNQYTFVSHDAVTAKVRPALLKHGVIYFPQNLKTSCETFHKKEEKWLNNEKVLVDAPYTFTTAHMDVEFVNIDKPEEKILVPSFGYGIDNQDKGAGKAMSYAVKYALLKALGLETGDDPERENINFEPEKKYEFTRDDKMFQRDFLYDLSCTKTTTQIDELLSRWHDDFGEKPAVITDMLKDAANNRAIGLKNKVAFPPAKYGFIDVKEAVDFTQKVYAALENDPDPYTWFLDHDAELKAIDDTLKAEKYVENGKTVHQRIIDAYNKKYPQAAE